MYDKAKLSALSVKLYSAKLNSIGFEANSLAFIIEEGATYGNLRTVGRCDHPLQLPAG